MKRVVVSVRRFSRLSGPTLAEMIVMKREAPESLYSLLRDEQFSLVDILKLNVAFRQIS